jgi:hypothetical protein
MMIILGLRVFSIVQCSELRFGKTYVYVKRVCIECIISMMLKDTLSKQSESQTRRHIYSLNLRRRVYPYLFDAKNR